MLYHFRGIKQAVLLLLYIGIFVTGCKKIDIGTDTLKTSTLTILSPGTPSLGGIRLQCNSSLSSFGSNFTYGFCYALTGKPVIPGPAVASDNFSGGSFSASVSNLLFGKKYYVRAFVTNGATVTYSNLDSILVPEFNVINQVKDITARSVDIVLHSEAAPSDTVTQRGICYGSTSNPTIDNFTIFLSSLDTGFTTLHISDSLKPGLTYYLRPVVIAGQQVYYGIQQTVKIAGYKGGSGGYVFFDKGDTTSGWRYLEAVADTSLLSGNSWGCPGTDIITGTTPGTGYTNTEAIIAACNATGTAAAACRGITKNGKTDWYLPALEEMQALYELKLAGLTEVSSRFLTSSQASAATCFVVDLGTGATLPLAKDDTSIAWPIRRFK